ncbi:MAG: GNAT family N-acetyltransferase [Eubacterium sp.]
MNYLIRQAKITDAGAICNLNIQELGYRYPLSKTIDKLKVILNSANDIVLVAEYGKIIVGYIHACNYDVIYAPSVKNIMGIAVDEKYKRNGIGTALLKAVETWAKENGAGGVRLASGSTRVNAHNFYTVQGYKCDKTQLRFIKYFNGVVD